MKPNAINEGRNMVCYRLLKLSMFKSGAGSHHPLLVLSQKTAKVALLKIFRLRVSVMFLKFII